MPMRPSSTDQVRIHREALGDGDERVVEGGTYNYHQQHHLLHHRD